MLELYLFFSLLAMAYVVEMTVSVTRIVGLNNFDLGAAITLQSALALGSRLVVFVYMPLAGFVVDFSSQSLSMSELLFPVAIIPALLFIIAMRARDVTRIVGVLMQRALVNGSYFSLSPEESKILRVDIDVFKDFSGSYDIVQFGELKSLVVLLSYILYYAAWPVIFTFIHAQPEYRTTIFASAALFTGLNTACMALIADPTTLSLAKKNKGDCEKYLKLLIRMRVYAALIAFLVFMLVGLVFDG
jgi:hypothetical protein